MRNRARRGDAEPSSWSRRLGFWCAAVVLLAGVTFLPNPAGSAFTSATANGASTFTTAATFSEGALYVWGDNAGGQLGLGDTAGPRTSPVQLGAVVTWTGVTQGLTHMCATRADDTLWCWGDNTSGQLGVGNVTATTAPVQVTGTTWRSATAGRESMCATKTDNTLWCWGENSDGQVGQGNTTTPATSPVQIGAFGTWSSVDAGEFHACAIRIDGTLWCWGRNGYGQIGLGNIVTPVTSPVQVGADTDWISVDGGTAHTCALKADGSLWCWGDNSYGQVGRGDIVTPATSPVQVGVATTWRSVAAGGFHTCAVRVDNTLWCWGWNGYAQLGRGDTVSPATSPVQVPGTTWQSVSASVYHTCALQTDSTLWCWGDNYYGEIGRGDTATPAMSPVRVVSPATWQTGASFGPSEFSAAIR